MVLVDRSLVLRKIADLEMYAGQMEEFSGITAERYEEDWKTQRIVERTLQMMIETCVDIAAHVVSDNKLRIPTSYADTFRVLMEASILDGDLFSVMEKMAKFRNVIVHQYERVDAAIVVLILQRHLKDFECFKEAVLAHLKEE